MPFKNYEFLSTVNRGYFQMTQETGFEIRDGIFMSGKATGGFVRASVSVTEVAGEQDAELSDADEETESTGKEREKKISSELESIIDGPLIAILPYLQK